MNLFTGRQSTRAVYCVCSLQSTSSETRSSWQDIAQWISDSWPWPALANHGQPMPLRIQPSDIGFDVTDDRTPVNGKDFTTIVSGNNQQSADRDPRPEEVGSC